MAQPLEAIDPRCDPHLAGDFRNFMAAAWRHLRYGDPTRLQYWLASRMQHGPRQQCNMAFRGFGKSVMTSGFGDFRIYRDPERKFLQLGSAKDRAEAATRFMLGLIVNMDVLQHLKPEADQRGSTTKFDVAGCIPAIQPSVAALGIGSNVLTGSRCHDYGCDDIETRKNSLTHLMRQRVDEAFRELSAAVIRSPDEVWDPREIINGTPQLEESFYFELEERGYDVTVIPARYPTEEQFELYRGKLCPSLVEDLKKDPSLVGMPTEPSRFGEETLIRRELKYGKLGFLLQFMLLPGLADSNRYPLKINDLIVMDLDPDVGPQKVIWSGSRDKIIQDLACSGFKADSFHSPAHVVGERYEPYTSSVMTIDPSGRGADELSYAVAKTLNAQIFLLAIGGYLHGYNETTLKGLAMVAKRFKIPTIVYEDNMGDGMWGTLFAPILAKIHPDCQLDSVHHSTQKEARLIDTIEPVASNHRLIVSKTVVQTDMSSVQDYESDMAATYQLFHQMARLTRDKGCLAHEDRLEALAMACAYFRQDMELDYEDEMAAQSEAAFDQQLEEFEASFGLNTRQHPCW